MAEIVFEIPHLFQPYSSYAENEAGRAILKTCLDTMRKRSARGGRKRLPSLVRSGQTQVTWDLPHVFQRNSTPRENAEILSALLHCLTSLNLDYLMRHSGTAPLYGSGVYYKRTQIWDSIPALYARGYGDCKSLACALGAEYNAKGVDCNLEFRFTEDKMMFHILVMLPTGNEDPSKVLGMGADEVAWFYRQTG